MPIRLDQTKKKKKTTLEDSVILGVIFIFLSLVIVAYFFLLDYNSKNEEILNRKNAVLNNIKDDFIEVENVERLLITESQKINFVKELIYNRELASNFFNFIEVLVHPNIYFNNLELNTQEREVRIEGVALDFDSLGEQIKVMQEEAKICKGDISGIMKIRANELKETMNNHIITFEIDDQNIKINLISPEGRNIGTHLIRLIHSDTQNNGDLLAKKIEDGIFQLSGEDFTVTFLKEVSIEDLDGKALSFFSQNIIDNIYLSKAITGATSIDAPFRGVDFEFILKLNPIAFGIE